MASETEKSESVSPVCGPEAVRSVLPKNQIIIGGCAPSFLDQAACAGLSKHDLGHFDKDSDAITRLMVRGLIAPTIGIRARNRLAKKIFAALKRVRSPTATPQDTPAASTTTPSQEQAP